MLKRFSLALTLLLVSGCASYGVVDNQSKAVTSATAGYSIQSGGGSGWGSGDIALILAFSGGGTRAAALAYGVLEELRDTNVLIDGTPRRLLDETDIISSVSGGSFTSAYYGLYGDRIFEDYEAEFLRRNVQGQLIRGLNSYFKKDRRQYAHFVDGGITDNLGLRAIYEIIEISGGAKAFVEGKLGHKPLPRLVIISVNASTDREPEMDLSNKQPSLRETISAMSDVQLHRYDLATLELMDRSLTGWAKDLSAPGRPVTPYFMKLGFRDIAEPQQSEFLNQVPTSFSLTDEQVDMLIAAGRGLLRNNPDFQRLVTGLEGTTTLSR